MTAPITDPPTAAPGAAATSAGTIKTVTVTSDAGTDYYILSRSDDKRDDGASVWILVATTNARDTAKAIEKYASENGNKPGTYVAVPASRWTPLKVTPQTVTTLKLEEAK